MTSKEQAKNSKRTARWVGIFLITATVKGILGMAFSAPLQTSDYLVGVAENETQVVLAALATLLMAVAVASIAITAYPVLRKQNEVLALGYVGARIVEGMRFIVTVFSWLLLITLSREYVQAGVPEGSFFKRWAIYCR